MELRPQRLRPGRADWQRLVALDGDQHTLRSTPASQWRRGPNGKLLPPGSVQHRNDYGSAAFGGACPREGDKAHRYQFKVFALDIEKLEIAPESSAALVGFMINAHKLGVAELEALYRR